MVLLNWTHHWQTLYEIWGGGVMSKAPEILGVGPVVAVGCMSLASLLQSCKCNTDLPYYFNFINIDKDDEHECEKVQPSTTNPTECEQTLSNITNHEVQCNKNPDTCLKGKG